MPSRWLLCTCATGALIGISWKFGPPSREICVSTYEWMRPGQQRIVGEVDARHDVRGAERDLLGLGEEVVGVAVQHQPADRHDRHQLLRDDLGRVQHVEGEAFGLLLGEELKPELVSGIGARLDRFPEIAAVEVRNRRRRSSPPRPTPANACRALGDQWNLTKSIRPRR